MICKHLVEGRGGSPPRVRGIREMPIRLLDSIRFTPAGAGNTKSSILKKENLTVHPRGCGEYYLTFRLKKETIGSPPRVRGIRSAEPP